MSELELKTIIKEDILSLDTLHNEFNIGSVPKGSKLYFCKDCKFSRDFIRDAGNFTITYDANKADYVIVNPFVIKDILDSYWIRKYLDNGNNTIFSYTWSYYTISQRNHVEDILAHIAKNKFRTILDVFPEQKEVMSNEDYHNIRKNLKSNFNIFGSTLTDYKIEGINKYYLMCLFLEFRESFYSSRDKYLSQIFFPFMYKYQLEMEINFSWESYDLANSYVRISKKFREKQEPYDKKLLKKILYDDFVQYINLYKHQQFISLRLLEFTVKLKNKFSF